MRILISRGGFWVEISDSLKEEAVARSSSGGTVAPGPSARQQQGEVHSRGLDESSTMLGALQIFVVGVINGG